jgi:hypothetical protein
MQAILADSRCEMQAWAGAASAIAVCRIAWAEMMAALARQLRYGPRIELIRPIQSVVWGLVVSSFEARSPGHTPGSST